MTVCYLDIDDEITNAVSRVRVADDALVTIVLPPGSRIATSRINFLILAREARARGRTLAVVSGEAGVRALAVSAGLPAYPTVEESERALGAPGAPAGQAGASGGAVTRTVGGPTERRPGAFSGSTPGDRQTAGGGGGTPSGSEAAATPAAPVAGTLWAAAATTTDAAPGTATGASTAGTASGMRRVMARPAEPVAHTDLPARAPGSGSTPAPDIAPRVPHDVTWRDEPWRDPRGRVRDTARTTVIPGVEPRAVAPHSAAVDAGSTAGATQTSARARAVEERAHRRAAARRRFSFLGRLTVVLAIMAILAGGAYLYLPTADITITPRTQTAGPVSLDVVADPAIRVVDATRARIPADRPEIPLSVRDQFPATGTAVTQTRATGSITFTTEDTHFDVSVPAGTRVSTAGGIAFTTRRGITIPKASIATGASSRDVDVQAVQVGPGGNVPAGAITRVPASLSDFLTTVTNPAPTTGGRRTEAKQVQKRDYDAAVKKLTARLDDELAKALQDPATAGQGMTVYPQTASVEDVRPDQTAGDLVGTRATSFTLTMSATGRVLVVDRSLVENLATDRLDASVPQGFRLLDGTTRTTIGDPEVANGTIRYPVAARALQWRPVEPSTIITAVRGRRIQEAKTTLERFGSADVQHWPDFLDTMPSQDFRITVRVLDPVAP